MKYLGGKARLAKQIVEVLVQRAEDAGLGPTVDYLEPFVGGGSVLCAVPKHWNRTACDVNEALITMYKALQQGWVPPTDLSREEYYALKQAQDPLDPLTAFAGFACSFAAKWFGGYAAGDGRNYAAEGARNLEQQMSTLLRTEFHCLSVFDIQVTPGSLVYCDPPYAGTTGYDGAGDFDTPAFWNWVRDNSDESVVIVSEYEAPTDFECIWERQHKCTVRRFGDASPSTERLFRYPRRSQHGRRSCSL